MQFSISLHLSFPLIKKFEFKFEKLNIMDLIEKAIENARRYDIRKRKLVQNSARETKTNKPLEKKLYVYFTLNNWSRGVITIGEWPRDVID